jgi:hypothetical protein
MKPDLVSVNVVNLTFYVELPLSDQLVNDIHEASPPDEDGDSGFFDSYAVQRHGHGAIAWVISPATNESEFRISFNYALAKAERLPKKLPKVEQLIDVLSNIRQEATFNCSVTFQFGKREPASSVVVLPIRISRSATIPFDEVRGIRLVKLEDNKILYSVILDLTSEGALHQNIGFSHSANFSRTLVDDILHKATDISRKFITKE